MNTRLAFEITTLIDVLVLCRCRQALDLKGERTAELERDTENATTRLQSALERIGGLQLQ